MAALIHRWPFHHRYCQRANLCHCLPHCHHLQPCLYTLLGLVQCCLSRYQLMMLQCLHWSGQCCVQLVGQLKLFCIGSLGMPRMCKACARHVPPACSTLGIWRRLRHEAQARPTLQLVTKCLVDSCMSQNEPEKCTWVGAS